MKFNSIQIKFLILVLLLIIVNNTYSQETGTLQGVVTDSSNGEILAYANVYINALKTGTATDSKGIFVIPTIPSGRSYLVSISYIGYKTKKIVVYIGRNKITLLKAKLSPSNVELGTIEKVANKISDENMTRIGVQKISMKQLALLPKGVETDIFRALRYLPGIQSTSDISARLNVRGGASNQNLFLLDDMPVYNPFHALGLFGAIDPEVINNVELHIGGFGSEYAGRLSSVIKLISKDGNKNKYRGSVGASLMSLKGSLQGPSPGGSFILSGRKSYSNSILNNFFEKEDLPIYFYDLFIKGNFANEEFLPGGKFSVKGFLSGDKIINNNPLVADVKWSNSVWGIEWSQFTDSPLYYNISLSQSIFEGELIPNSSGVRPIKNKIKDYTGKMDMTYVLDNGNKFVGGYKIKVVTVDLVLNNSYGLSKNIGKSSGANANISAYLKFLLEQFEDFSVDIGTRLNLIGLSRGVDGIFLEPRASFSLNFIPRLAFKFSWGLYQQELTTLTDEDEVITFFEPWLITPDYLDPARAIHYITGLEWNPSDRLSFNVEGYYKIIQNFPTLNNKKAFENDPDLVGAKGESYGIDVLTIYNNPLFGCTASYSFSRAFKEVNNITYPPRYDIRHSLKLGMNSNIYKDWNLSATWIINTGMPFTQLRGFYDKLHLDYESNIFSIFGSQLPVPILEGRNLARLPVYHRLDLSLSKKFKIASVDMYLDLSIINVYNRKNLFYFNRNTGKRINMLPFLTTATIKLEI